MRSLEDTLKLLESLTKNCDNDCKVDLLRPYTSNLQGGVDEEEKLENDFKDLSQIAKGLVKETSSHQVNEMLSFLKGIKERIVIVRRALPAKLKNCKSLLSRVESFEDSISEIKKWIEEGENMVAVRRIDSNINDVEDRLERHSHHFGANVEKIKNDLQEISKFYKKISTEAQELGFKSYYMKSSLKTLNERFQKLCRDREIREQNLNDSLKKWKNLQKSAAPLENWLTSADNALTTEAKSVKTDIILEEYKTLLDQANNEYLEKFQKAASDLLNTLDPKDTQELRESVKLLCGRWSENKEALTEKLSLVKFAKCEEDLTRNFHVADETLNQFLNQQLQGIDSKELLHKHNVIFQDSAFISSCEKLLAELKSLAHDVPSHKDQLLSRYLNHGEFWNKLQDTIVEVGEKLQDSEKRWNNYHKRLSEFECWMNSVEKIIDGLERPTPRTSEYKDTFAQFNVSISVKFIHLYYLLL